MSCAECGAENREGARFCRGCGAALAERCHACGADLIADSRFCDACGASCIPAPSGPSQASATRDGRAADLRPPDRDLSEHAPRHLIEKILTSKSAIEGERKQVTVLFVDIQRSVAIAEGIDAEEWHSILDRFFQILSKGVHRFEGTINQFTGDGIMALFGAPIAHEDHAQRGCLSALLLQRLLRRYSQQLKRERGIAFSTRMGLNSGEVVVGKIGDDLRMDYTAQGHTVNLASRIEQLASPETPYLTANTAKLVQGFFELEALGPFNLKGVRDPVEVFELRGRGRLRTRLDQSRARGFSRFVGRDAETAILEASLERAISGEGQVLAIQADAGTGKSRLCFEFLEVCRARDIAVQEARCVSHGKNIPYLPVLELLRGYFGIKDDDSEETVRDKIAGRIVRLDERLTEDLPHLFEFLGVPDPHRPAPPLNAEVREGRIFRIVARVMEARSEQRPAVILIEDLHWIDGATQSFVDSLVDKVADTRTLLLLNYRPEYQTSFPNAPCFEELELRPLPPAAIDELLLDLLGKHPSLGDLPERIRARTEGNPFFIEELIQFLAETGALEGVRGAYQLVESIKRVEIAPSVRAVLAARIDRLEERAKNLLRTASVIGKSFSEPALRRISGASEDDLSSILRSLMRSQFIFEASLFPELEYSFMHPLTQEVAYESQLGDRRRRTHASVARATQELSQERLDEQSALIAHHWEKAGEPLRAAHWHRRAANWAGYNHLSEALRHWQQVLGLIQPLSESPESLELGTEALGHVIMSRARLGGTDEEVEALFAQGSALSQRLADPSVEARFLTQYGMSRAAAGRLEQAIPPLERALALVDETADDDVEAGALYALGVASLSVSGDCQTALILIDRGLAITHRDSRLGSNVVGAPVATLLVVWKALALALMGRLRESELAFERVRSLAGRQQPMVAGIGYWAHSLMGDLVGTRLSAMSRGRRALELAGENPMFETLAHHTYGFGCLLNDQTDEAVANLERALLSAREHGSYRFAEPMILIALSRALRSRGDAEAALRIASEAAELTRARGWLGANAQIALARALIERGPKTRAVHERASEALDDALRLTRESGAISLRPFVHDARAAIAQSAGDEAQAERERREADRLYASMAVARRTH